MRRNRAAILWVVVVVAMCGWLAWKLADEVPISADLMSLLPSTERDPVVEQAAKRFRQAFETRVAFLVAAPDAPTAQRAADHAFGALQVTGRFRSLRLRYDEDASRRIGQLYFPHRFQLLSEAARAQIQDRDWTALERSLVAGYYSPAAPLTSDLVANDPYLFLSGFLRERAGAAPGNLKLDGGYLTATLDQKAYVLISAELAGSPFSFDVQDGVVPAIADMRRDLAARFPQAELLMAGLLPHAIAGTSRARAEVSTVGLGSVLGIVLLFIMVFRSWRPLSLSLLSLAVGCLGGFAACLTVFGHVHLLTLVFGTSLVGIAVDYALHYFCEQFRLGDDWSSEAALRHIFPGITLGLITSIIGFAGLFFAPFPGLQEMAVFSIAGLVFAYGCVVAWLPSLSRTALPARNAGLLALMGKYARFWRVRPGWHTCVGGAAVLGVLIFGCFQLEFRDDIRLLQSLDPKVVAEQSRVGAVIGRVPAVQFFLVEGRDPAELLEREEKLTAELRQLEQDGVLGSHMALSDIVPSPARQMENRLLLEAVIDDEGGARRRLADAVGLKEALLTSYVDAFRNAAGEEPLRLDQWLEDPLPDAYAQLWLGAGERGVIAAVGLDDLRDPAAMRGLERPEAGVHFIDGVDDLSTLFGAHRRTTLMLTVASYVVVALILQMRYGLLGGLAVMAPPVIAAIASLGIPGLLGLPISLFNIMAQLLVLGIGVDYGVFFRETGHDGESTMLAIALSAVTTILGFGLLAFSATAAIHAFGLTVMIGITVAVLLSPLGGLGVAATQRTRRA